MDPSATPAVPLGPLIVSWVLASVTAVAAAFAAIAAWSSARGTKKLAEVGEAQLKREQEHQERQDKPQLMLTGALAGRGSNPGVYTVDLVNWSARAIWLDGVYAEWWTPRGDGRLAMKHTSHTRHRTPVGPGDWVTLVEPFKQSSEDASEEDRQTEIVAQFYYGPGETESRWRAWRIKGQGPAMHVRCLKELPRWFVERQEALAGAPTRFEGAWPAGASASSSAVHGSADVVGEGGEDER